MRMHTSLIASALISVVAIQACKTRSTITSNTDNIALDGFNWENIANDSNLEERWTGNSEILFSQYRGSETRFWDLIHTELNLEFDFLERRAIGTADITLKPHFTGQYSLTLDAQNMDIKRVSASGGFKITQWEYSDSAHLNLYFWQEIKQTDTLIIHVEYTALPYQKNMSGNDAIQGDRGLYFINHDLSNPLIPRQIWSQGETESNSHWFPTLDAPNQKMTQRIRLSVPDSMTTLSNGILESSKSLPNKRREDVWFQSKAHAPYLTMIAAGNWSVTQDQWRGKAVNYLVEKQYEPYAKLIFGNTPEMMEFYSNYLGTEFPWDKYSQVVVREFVSGAMENTSATVHMEQLQHTADEHLDETYEDYISHELFHQWFGDLVTAESWSNITLNESFATYGEYLWREHKYGQDNADAHLEKMRIGYKNRSAGKGKHLARYEYDNSGDVFDDVSYQKGGSILHMLRYELGEDVFRAGLKQYLKTKAFQSAEIDELRLAFESVSGRDLHWFFNQWYFDAEHPTLQLFFVEKDKEQYLQIQQTQTHRNTYALSYDMRWGHGNKEQEMLERRANYKVRLEKRTHEIPLGGSMPNWIVLDASNTLLADFDYAATDAQELARMIRMLHAGFSRCGAGSGFTNFKLACKLADVDGNESSNDAIVAAFIPFFVEAVHSGYDPTVSRAMYFANAHPEFHFFGEITAGHAAFLGLARDTKLAVDTRINALYSAYYKSAPADSLIPFTQESSQQLCRVAISLLDDKNKWMPLAMMGLSDKRGAVAVMWGSKLMRFNESSYNYIMHELALNPAVKSKDYYTAMNIFLSFCPEDRLATELEKLGQQLQDLKITDKLKVQTFAMSEFVAELDQIQSTDSRAKELSIQIHEILKKLEVQPQE